MVVFPGDVMHVHTFDNQQADHTKIAPVLGTIAKVVQAKGAVNCAVGLFTIREECGTMAIAFLAHILLQKMLPVTPDDMGQVHEYLKGLFVQNRLMNDLCLKPWMWGKGAMVSMPRLQLRTPSMSALSPSDGPDQCPLASVCHVIGCDHAASVSMHSREPACANTNKRSCDLMLSPEEDQSDPNSDK